MSRIAPEYLDREPSDCPTAADVFFWKEPVDKKEEDGEEEDDGQRDLTAVVPRRVRAIPRASLSRSIGQLHPSERVVRSHKTVSR